MSKSVILWVFPFFSHPQEKEKKREKKKRNKSSVVNKEKFVQFRFFFFLIKTDCSPACQFFGEFRLRMQPFHNLVNGRKPENPPPFDKTSKKRLSYILEINNGRLSQREREMNQIPKERLKLKVKSFALLDMW